MGAVPTHLVLTVLLAHFLADFVLQSDDMATNKSRSFGWLTYHVAVYAAGLALVTACVTWGPRIGPWLVWLGVNVVAHWLTDALTSRITARLYAAGQRHWFFVTIGLDQLIHVTTLVATLDLVTN